MLSASAALGLFLMAGLPARAEIPASLVNKLKPTVVNLEVSTQHGLESNTTGRRKGSGFIVDAKRGIIATNRHVVGTSPSHIKIVFEDGDTAEGSLWHYDAWHDFAFVRIKPETRKKDLEAVRLGDSFKLKEQDDVLLIGNNDGQEYSIKFGKTANLWLNRGARHTATIQTTFDRAGGSSGSPVFNAKGEVIGIHFSGTSTTSFEMRIEYLKTAFKQLRESGKVRRGEIGLELDLMLIADAEKHFHLPVEIGDRIKKLRKGLKRVAFVKHTVPRSAAHGPLMAGDIVLEIAGKQIGDDLYLFDKLVDDRVGKSIGLKVVRNGKTLSVNLQAADAEKTKLKSFALFAGGVLHDVTPNQRLRLNIVDDGVFLTQAEKGSSLSGLGREGSHTKYLLLIHGLNGNRTPDLETFIRTVRPLKHGEHIYVLTQDRWVTQSSTNARMLRLDLKYFPLRVFDWSDEKLDWIAREDIAKR